MQPLQWLLIVTSMTLIFVVFAINPMQAATDEAIRNSARLEALRLASIINVMSTAPDRTTYSYEMLSRKCTATITEGFVKMKITFETGQELTETVGLVKTPTRITGGEFDCKTTRSLQITKNEDTITFG